MLRGYCLDSEILPTNILFYLFPHGKHNFYVSRFPKKGAHTGSVRRSMFSIVEEQEAAECLPEPPKKRKPVERNVHFSAKLVWSYETYHRDLVGKTCFVIARGEGLHVDVYASAKFTHMLGCYPIHWFKNFKRVKCGIEIETEETQLEQVMVEEIFDEPLEKTNFEQITLF